MRVNRQTLGGLLVATVMGFAASGVAHADKVYKWVDEQGVTHYGEKAPKGSESTKIKVSDTTSSDADSEIDRLNKTRADIQSARTESEPAKPAANGKAAENLDEANRKACETHRNNLTALKQGKRPRVLDESGMTRVLTEAERQAHVDLAESELKRCEQLEKLRAAKGNGAASK